VFVAYREQEEQTLKTLLQKQQAYGLNISWLDSGDLRKLIPHLNPEGLIGGTYSPNDGSASPLLSIHAFYKQARNYGAEFHFNEPVTEIIVRSGKIQGVKTSKGMYSTPVVIHASGAWAKSLMNPIGIEIPVQPDSHEAAITEPVQRMFDPMIVDIRPAQGSANFYFYQHKTGQILFCITPSPNIWGFDIRETSAFLPMVSKRMVEVMPSLRHIRIRRTWRGLYPMTPDGFPIVGWSREAEGLLLAVGMCGQGYMLGPGLGELLTRMVTNTLSPGDEEILSILSPYREFVGQEKLK
jgi:sarcosine oxidase subunit beta